MLKSTRKYVAPFAAVAVPGIATLMAMTGTAQAYGQFGPPTTNPITWEHQVQADGLAGQVQALEARNGIFHRMDGPWSEFVKTRVVMAPIIQSADPVDYGEENGSMYSVGHRVIPAGTDMFVALPAKYTKSEIRTTSHKGYRRVTVTVSIVGKTNCDNAEVGPVKIHLWIKIKVVSHRKHVVVHNKHVVVHKRTVHKKSTSTTKKPVTCTSGTHPVVIQGQIVCQSNTNTTTQTGTTSGQGSPVININQTTQVNVNQGQGQGQTQTTTTTSTPPPPPTPQCSSTQFGTYPNCYSFSISVNTQNQEFDPGNQDLTICADVAGSIANVKYVQFTSDHYGAFLDGGYVTQSQSGDPAMFCDSSYAVGTEDPPNGVTNVYATAGDALGNTVTATGQMTITDSPPFQ